MKGDALSPKRTTAKTALELDSYTVYTLSIADKFRHIEHTLQYLAHV